MPAEVACQASGDDILGRVVAASLLRDQMLSGAVKLIRLTQCEAVEGSKSLSVQAGTPLRVLQELGSWECVEMVRKYAHLASDHLVQIRRPHVRLAVSSGRRGSGYDWATRRKMKRACIAASPLPFLRQG